ncbi:MAG: TonB-dependent receptor [Acidobacteriota bacterium]|jgi:hypothetical protein
MRKVALLFVAVALVAMPAMAQVQYGSVSGTVVDNQGQPLPGVVVTLSGPTMQGSRTAVTDTAGKFRFMPVPPGSDYSLKLELAGFNTVEKTGITVNLGRDTAILGEMTLSEFAETVTVTADRVVVDTTKSTVDTTVDWEFMDNLPVNRNFQTIMQLAPSVRPGNNPFVAGGSNSSNVYMIDGVDTGDPRTQTWGTALNFDAIAEIQLQTAAFQAEYGRATGGILNLVTKSGGNNFSFTGRYVKQDADYSAKRGIDKETGRPKTGGGATDEARPIATLGGPILKDALWFYTTYEERDNSRGYSRYMTLQDRIDGKLTQGRTSYKGHYISGKLTWQVNPSHSVIAHYNEDPIELRPLRGGWYGAGYAPSAEQYQFQGGNNSSLQWTGVLSPSFFMEAKYQLHKQELNVAPDTEFWNQIPYRTNTTYGYNFGGPYSHYQSKRDRDGLLLTGNYYLDAGASSHQFKAGIEYLGLKPKTGTVYNSQGYYRERVVSGVITPLDYFTWTNQSGATKKPQDYYALYIQDQWRMGKLTLNLGIRAEQHEVFNNRNKSILKFSFGDTVAPRLGFAYDLNGDVIRGSVGRFYEMPSNYISDYFTETPGQNVYSRYLWNGSCAVDGRNPWEYPASCWRLGYSYELGSSAELDPKLDPAYMDEFTLGFEKRLSNLYAAGINFVFRKQDDIIDWYDPEASGYYYITNPVRQARADGYDIPNKYMEYQAMTLELRKRFGPDGFQFLANFTYAFKDDTWSASWRSVGPWVFTIPEAMDKNWYGRTNSKKLFKVAGSYTFPWKMVVGINGYWDEGNLYTATTPGVYGSIPLEKRGSSKVGSNWESDFYLEQPFKVGPVTLAGYFNVFNMFNNQQVTGRGSNSATPSTFRLPTAWQSPRSVQWGIKIEY